METDTPAAAENLLDTVWNSRAYVGKTEAATVFLDPDDRNARWKVSVSVEPIV